MSKINFSKKKHIIEKRSQLLKTLRDFFHRKGFLEVITPKLVSNPGLEPYFSYFKTKSRTHDMGSINEEAFYLPTSPEYHLKKAMAYAQKSVYEITPCFRNGEIGNKHEPEFLMLEWYRYPGTLKKIASDLKEILLLLSPKSVFLNHTVCELFQKFLEIDLNEALRKSSFSKKDIEKFQLKKFSCEEAFQYLFSEFIEKKLEKKTFHFIWDYPYFGGGLCQVKKDNSFYTSRFELFYEDLELANAFDEETNSKKQRENCLFDQEKRKNLYSEKVPPIDEELLSCLDQLSSKTSGIALGLDRLMMCVFGEKRIQDTVIFTKKHILTKRATS